MTEPKNLEYQQDGPVVTIAFNRPDVMNAISWELEDELHESLDVAEADDSVRAVILTGNGRAFSAGYDMSGPKDPLTRTADTLRHWWSRDHSNPEHMFHIMELEKPVIAAVNGFCMGGGFWYAMACDMTYASDKAVFAQPEVRHSSNTTALLPALVGWKHANRYALTGDHFDANEALRIGMLNDVIPHDDLLPTVQALARRIAQVPRDTVRLNKAIQNYTWQAMGLRNAVNQGSFLSIIAHSSYDADDIDHLMESRDAGDMKTFLAERDKAFIPEPFGPRSKK